MLDLNHPQTPYILEAAGYLNRIKLGCRKYIVEAFEDRQITFAQMKAECAALNQFAETAFPERLDQILQLTEKIVQEINRLAAIHISSDAGNCTVCNQPLHTFKTYVKEFPTLTICQHCSKKILDYLNELEVPTGVMWI
jgi:hypothetical protein